MADPKVYSESNDVCVQVFGKRWSELSDDERKQAFQYRRKVHYFRNHARKMAEQREDKRNIKLRIIEALGIEAKCNRCGYDRYVGALDFHHTDPTTKDRENALTNRAFSTVVEECRKCELVCSNCHREIHQHEHSHAKSGRPRKVDPMLEKFMRASGCSEDAIAEAMAGRTE